MIVASAGYRLFASAIDKSKVEAAAAGVRKLSPRNREARVAWELYLRDTTSVPPPSPPSPLAAIWQRDAVFTTNLGNFGEQRHDAWSMNFRVVYAQLLHNTAVDLQSTLDHLDLFRREGWTVVGWGTYGQGSADPRQDGRDAAALVRQYGLAGWKANGEAWAEAEHIAKTSAFVAGWQDAAGTGPLGWSVLSSDTDQYARLFDYVTALSVPGADIDIQVYGAAHPTYTVGAGLGMLRRTPVPVDRTTMTFDVTQEGDGPFRDYISWPGPRRVWTGERARAGFTFQQFAR